MNSERVNDVNGATKAAADAAEGVRATVEETCHDLGAQAAEIGERVYRQAVDAGRYARRQVEEQALIATVTAGVAGLLLGFLLGRTSAPQPRSMRDYAQEYLPRKFRG